MSARLAYTVSVRGCPDTACVHHHARGAMVNWLYLEGLRIRDDIPDEHIRLKFMEVRDSYPEKDIQLALVRVESIRSLDPETVDLLAPARDQAPLAPSPG